MTLSHPKGLSTVHEKQGCLPQQEARTGTEVRQALTPPPKPLLNPPETQATHSKGASTPPEPEEGSEGSQGQSTGLEAGFQ